MNTSVDHTSQAASSSGAPAASPAVENVIIIGAGPAAFTAALYAARASLRPLVLGGDSAKIGGQLITTTIVENYPGFAQGIDGGALTQAMETQAVHAGARLVAETVTRVSRTKIAMVGAVGAAEHDGFIVETDQNRYVSWTVIVASGAYAKRDDIPGTGDKELWNRGVSACATCDGALYKRSKRIMVIGGGDTAMEEALFLTRFAEEVGVVHRRAELRASKVMADRAMKHPKIKFYWNSRIARVTGNGKVERVTLASLLPNVPDQELEANAVFFAIGHLPNSDFVKDLVQRDDSGYIITVHGSPDTGVPGLYAAGDVADKEYRQAITAAGEGCKAALLATRYLEALLPSS